MDSNNSIIYNLRKYRLKLESYQDFFNSNNDGIALFDLIGTYLVAILLYFTVLSKTKIKKNSYFLSIVPIFIIIHLITGQQTYLNTQLFNSNFNIYKILISIIVISLGISFIPSKNNLSTTKP